MDVRLKARRLVNRLLYGMPDRYGHLVREITGNARRTIMEIGVWDGEHAKMMIQAAVEKRDAHSIAYYGFDLFEDADEKTLAKEVSKLPPSLEVVRNKLRPFADMGVTINLYKGDSTTVLPRVIRSLPPMDFVFIDGGHSYETVASDWQCVKHVIGERSVVIFDDYVNAQAVATMRFGVNRLIDELDRRLYHVSLLRPVDSFKKEWGDLRVRFARVAFKSKHECKQ